MHIGLLPEDGGYDHNFVLDNQEGKVALSAILHEPISGRMLKLFTDQKGLQLYTGNLFDGSVLANNKIPLRKHAAVALEAEAFPDAPNQPGFPNTILRPGDIYQGTCIYQFLICR